MMLFGGGAARGLIAPLVITLAIVTVAALVGLGAVVGWLGVYIRESIADDDPDVTDKSHDDEDVVESIDEPYVAA